MTENKFQNRVLKIQSASMPYNITAFVAALPSGVWYLHHKNGTIWKRVRTESKDAILRGNFTVVTEISHLELLILTGVTREQVEKAEYYAAQPEEWNEYL